MSLLDPFIKKFVDKIDIDFGSIDVIPDTEKELRPDCGIPESQVIALITANAIFGSIFLIGFGATIMMIVRREINDLFLKYALVCLIIALALTTIVCFCCTGSNSMS